MSRPQQTISQPASLRGRGFFTNAEVTITFRPAAENTGRIFRRTDLASAPEIPALIEYAVDQERRTMLKNGKAEIQLTEHVLAALAGLRIDNCIIEVDGPEVPGMDGSAYPFVEALIDAGIKTQAALSTPTVFTSPLKVTSVEEVSVEYLPREDAGLSIRYELDYGEKSPVPAGNVGFEITPDIFTSQIAATRTFIAESEIEALRAAGYGTWVTPADLLILGSHGPLQNGYRYDDECARHKLLDCVGDFALLGADLEGHIVATQSGHALNRELVRVMRQAQTQARKHAA